MFQEGDIIEWCDERFKVIKDFGDSGIVEDMAGDRTNSFQWNYCGEKAKLIEHNSKNSELSVGSKPADNDKETSGQA